MLIKNLFTKDKKMRSVLLFSILIVSGAFNFINSQTITNQFYNVSGAIGNGVRFWNSDFYKIHMGTGSEYSYGPVYDYSIKMNMNTQAGRGWVWGVNGYIPVASISNLGKMQIKGNFATEQKIGIGMNESNIGLYMLDINSVNYGLRIKPTPTTNWQLGLVVDVQGTGTSKEETFRALSVQHNGNHMFWVQGDGTTRINNTLYAQEIFVKTNVWPDFVFKKDYPLISLYDVENYIKENNHLPNIPSEEEVINGGINVSEMNVLLLQKIEELTLYAIKQQKLIDEMKHQINKLIKKEE